MTPIPVGKLGAALGIDPNKIAEEMLLGDFGQGLSKFVNGHQKGNRLLMETLTGRPYPLKAITPQQLFDSTQGEGGNLGLVNLLEGIVKHQQHDIIAALQAAVSRGTQQALRERAAQIAPAPAAQLAETDVAAAPDATIHGPPPEAVQVADAGEDEDAADDSEE